MAKRILQIVATAYRATLEEQDDPVLWLATSLRNNGADIHILLLENGTTYAVRGQDASGLAFGERRQTQPPRIEDDLARLLAKGASILAVEEDLAARGIAQSELISGVELVPAASLPSVFKGYDQIWKW